VYPNYKANSILLNGEEGEEKFGCMENEFFIETFADGEEDREILYEKVPHHYDPRCRGWYRDQYKKQHSIFTDVYQYASGRPGITNCVPLWSSDRETFYGAYCLDQFPTSEDTTFVRKYYDN